MACWVDQTLNQALRQSVSWPQLTLIVRNLVQMSITVGDVWLCDWEEYLRMPNSETDSALVSYIKKEWRTKIQAGRQEIDKAIRSGFGTIVLVCSYTPGLSWEALLGDELEKLCVQDKEIYIELENAACCPEQEFEFLWPLLQQYPIQGLIYADCLSGLDAFSTFAGLAALQKTAPVPLEFHGYNAYGLATANSLAALRAGVARVAVSVGGVGSQTALEEIWMAQAHFLAAGKLPAYFAECCRKILISMGLDIAGNKAIIGKDIFSHESGIHVDGVTKNPQLYEPFSPEEVGVARKLVIGKHSGTAAIQYKLSEWKLCLTKKQTAALLQAVRKLAVAQKAAVTEFQLKELYWKTVKS
jgi:homocitrate synthase NifV